MTETKVDAERLSSGTSHCLAGAARMAKKNANETNRSCSDEVLITARRTIELKQQ